MKKIVVFGSINTDLSINCPYIPTTGETLTGNDFYISFGGKGANQAVAASKLGADVSLVGCVGSDKFGEEVIRVLNDYNVDTKHIRSIDNVSTGVAVIIKVGLDNRIILNKGANDFLKSEDLSSYMLKHINKNSIFVTCLENNKDEVFSAIRLAYKANMITIFNPAPAINISDNIYEFVNYLVINQTEANILTNIYPYTIDDVQNVYLILKQKGLKVLIVTLGVLGSIIASDEYIKKIDSAKVNTVDSTGAGDAYIGAIAYCLSMDMDIYDACTYASYASAISVTKKGTYDAYPTFDEVNCFKRRNEIER